MRRLSLGRLVLAVLLVAFAAAFCWKGTRLVGLPGLPGMGDAIAMHDAWAAAQDPPAGCRRLEKLAGSTVTRKHRLETGRGETYYVLALSDADPVQVTPAVFETVEEGDVIRDRLPAIRAAYYAPPCCHGHNR